MDNRKRFAITKEAGFMLILASFLISWAIANIKVDYNKLELGALAPVFIPPIIGIGSLIFFAIADLFVKAARLIIVTLLVLFNLYIGITIRMNI